MKPPKKVKLTVIPTEKKVEEKASEVMSEKSSGRTFDPRPEFRIGEDEFPQIKEWVTGKKYKLEIEVEQVGGRIEDWGDQKGKLVGSYKITKIGSDNDQDEETEKNFPKAMQKKK